MVSNLQASISNANKEWLGGCLPLGRPRREVMDIAGLWYSLCSHKNNKKGENIGTMTTTTRKHLVANLLQCLFETNRQSTTHLYCLRLFITMVLSTIYHGRKYSQA